MKSKISKYALLFFAFVFVLSIFSGCGTKQNGESEKSSAAQTQSSAKSTESVPEQKEPDVVKIVVFEEFAGSEYDGIVWETIQEKTNVKLDIMGVPGDQLNDKINIIMASQDIPDIFNLSNETIEINLANSNILLPINQYFDKAPNLKKYWEVYWPAMTHPDGNIYAIPAQQNLVQWYPYYREDWLDKLGLSVPTTVDEYFTVAVAVTEQDPDANGENDTYAFGATNGCEDMRYFDHIFAAYGVLPELWSEVDGKLTDNAILPGAKEALKFIHELYKAGAIDPEFITDDSTRHRTKLVQGTYGAPCDTYWFFNSYNPTYHDAFHEANPDGSWVIGNLLKSNYTPNSVGMRMLNRRGWLKTVVSRETENIDAVMRLLDFIATDEQQTLRKVGVEGITFKWNDEGKAEMLISTNDRMEYGISENNLATRDLTIDKSDGWVEVMQLANSTGVPNLADPFLIDEAGRYLTDLKNYTEEMYTKMIVGDVQIDGGFEDYVKEWNKRGGEELTEAYNKAYEESKN